MSNEKRNVPIEPALDGVVIVDKPVDWTSHDVVARLRKLFRTRRVGHTGTLDPFATGVLVVCINRATRLVQFLTGEDKEYLATIRFGFATDTGDLTGHAIGSPIRPFDLNEELIEKALTQFRGRIKQTPPMYSAKKVGGVKLYEMARRGEQIERQPIEIEIRQLELITGLQNDQCTVRVVCSSGTYIRTLAEDIGKQLGVGAHLTALRRTRAGSCQLSHAFTLEQLTALAEAEQLTQTITPMTEVLDLPEAPISAAERELVMHGRAISKTGHWRTSQPVKLTQNNQLIAVAEYNVEQAVLQPRIVF